MLIMQKSMFLEHLLLNHMKNELVGLRSCSKALQNLHLLVSEASRYKLHFLINRNAKYVERFFLQFVNYFSIRNDHNNNKTGR